MQFEHVFLLVVLCGMVQCAPNAIGVPILQDAEQLLNWAMFDWANPSTTARIIINYAEQGGDVGLVSSALQKFDTSDEEAMFFANSAIDQAISNGTENTLLFMTETFELIYSESLELFNQQFISAVRGGDERSQNFALLLDMLVRRNGCAFVEPLLQFLDETARAEGKMEIYIFSLLEKAGPATQCQDCQDVQNGDTSCAERSSYGQCEEAWMKQGYNCALTCGYCEYIDPTAKPQAGDLEQLITQRSTLQTGVRESTIKAGVNKDTLVFGDVSLMSNSQTDKIASILGGSAPAFQAVSAIDEQKVNTQTILSEGIADEPLVQEVAVDVAVPTPVDEPQQVNAISGLLDVKQDNGLSGTFQHVPVSSGVTFQPLYYEPVEAPIYYEESASTILEALQIGDILAATNMFAEKLLLDQADAQTNLVEAINSGYSDAAAQLIARMVIEFQVVFFPFSNLLESALNEFGDSVAEAIAQGVVLANNEGATSNGVDLLLKILNIGGTTTLNLVLGIEQELGGSNCPSMLELMQGVKEQAEMQDLSNAQLSLLMLGSKISDGCAP